MGEDSFDGQILAEKLSKLNSSQQSIESLSRWCISHRKKAKQIVETWDKLFKSAQREQRVSFLYVANDILQNSRRKGSEFVNEFWKVLPAALKHVYQNGDEHGRKAASRLVDIWEERKVFGSRGQNLKDEMLSRNQKDELPSKNPPSSVSNGKNLNPIKVVKRDAQAVRLKLAVGGLPEKILTAFELMYEENVNEEGAISNCKGAAVRVGEMEKDFENISFQENMNGTELVDKIKAEENVLQQCYGQLEHAESLRMALVSQLKEALQDQETKLELIRSEMQVAHSGIEQAQRMKQKLTSPQHSVPAPSLNNPMMVVEPNASSAHLQSSAHSVSSFAPPTVNEEENKKAAAAAVAAKLAASTSSAQMLTSVLSSLVAEEAASMNSGLKSAGFSSSLPIFSPEKRPRLEKSMAFPDVNNSEGVVSTYFPSAHPSAGSMPLAPSSGMQTMSNQVQTPYHPPPPPPPPGPPGNSAANQVVQSAAIAMGVLPYGYGVNSLPPSLPSHIAMGLARPAPPQQQQLQNLQPQSQQLQQQQQQQPSSGGYYRPPGIGFYGQTHQPSTPPVPRQ